MRTFYGSHTYYGGHTNYARLYDLDLFALWTVQQEGRPGALRVPARTSRMLCACACTETLGRAHRMPCAHVLNVCDRLATLAPAFTQAREDYQAREPPAGRAAGRGGCGRAS